MYCTECGRKIEDNNKFCTNCGHAYFHLVDQNSDRQTNLTSTNQEKWWYRLLKVIYIFIYLQILWIVPVVWSENSSTYVSGGNYSYYGHYEDTFGAAFGYSLLTIVIFVVILRLVKISVQYIILGYRPKWKKEFKIFF